MKAQKAAAMKANLRAKETIVCVGALVQKDTRRLPQDLEKESLGARSSPMYALSFYTIRWQIHRYNLERATVEFDMPSLGGDQLVE